MTFKNSFGHVFTGKTFGESHGEGLGLVIDGCPSGLAWDDETLQAFLSRRRPGQNAFVTARDEQDDYEILSGVYQNKTLGSPIALTFKNKAQRPEDYKNLQPRQGHADQAWLDKYAHVDLRGGGRSSGRETLSRVAVGAVARSFLKQISPGLRINVWMNQMGEIKNTLDYENFKNDFDTKWGLQKDLSFPDPSQIDQIKETLLQAKEKGESYGGQISVCIEGLDAGLGQPVFNKLKSDMAQALFSIGAVNSVSLGDDDVFKPGTLYHQQGVNTYGGIQGGISTGQNITLKVLLKPTSSILDTAKKGRHDPCILPRAVVVIEAMLAWVLADHYLLRRLDNL